MIFLGTGAVPESYHVDGFRNALASCRSRSPQPAGSPPREPFLNGRFSGLPRNSCVFSKMNGFRRIALRYLRTAGPNPIGRSIAPAGSDRGRSLGRGGGPLPNWRCQVRKSAPSDSLSPSASRCGREPSPGFPKPVRHKARSNSSTSPSESKSAVGSANEMVSFGSVDPFEESRLSPDPPRARAPHVRGTSSSTITGSASLAGTSTCQPLSSPRWYLGGTWLTPSVMLLAELSKHRRLTM